MPSNTTILLISVLVCALDSMKIVILDCGIPKTDVMKSKKSVANANSEAGNQLVQS